MRRPRPTSRAQERAEPTLLRSGLYGIGAIALGVVVLGAVAAAISVVVALLT